MWQSIYLCHSPHPPFSVHVFVQCIIYIRKINCLHFFSLVTVSTFVTRLPLTRPVEAAYVKCRIKGDPDLHTNQLIEATSALLTPREYNRTEKVAGGSSTQVLPLSHFSVKAIIRRCLLCMSEELLFCVNPASIREYIRGGPRFA